MQFGSKRWILVALCLLAGCRAAERSGNGASPSSASNGPVQTDTLTGLYEGGNERRRNQMCMIEREGRSTTFGLVTWSNGDTNCSGSGLATRDGKTLRLQMEGDQSCTLEARIDGRRVTLPSSIPAACSYYCGNGAQMSGVAFDKVGGAEPDALRAVDLVGDPLCGG